MSFFGFIGWNAEYMRMFEYREGPVLTLNYIRFKSKGTASLFSQRFRESDEHLRPVLEDY